MHIKYATILQRKNNGLLVEEGFVTFIRLNLLPRESFLHNCLPKKRILKGAVSKTLNAWRNIIQFTLTFFASLCIEVNLSTLYDQKNVTPSAILFL